MKKVYYSPNRACLNIGESPKQVQKWHLERTEKKSSLAFIEIRGLIWVSVTVNGLAFAWFEFPTFAKGGSRKSF